MNPKTFGELNYAFQEENSMRAKWQLYNSRCEALDAQLARIVVLYDKNCLCFSKKENFYDGVKMQDHERKSHKLTAKISCESFFIAAESQDYPSPTIEQSRFCT